MLIKVRTFLSEDQARRVIRHVVQFCKADINPLIVNTSMMALMRVRDGDENLILSEFTVATTESDLGTANLNCSRVDLIPNDKLIARVRHSDPRAYREVLRHWAGKDVEVIVLPDILPPPQ